MHVVGIKQIIERALVSYSGVTTSDGGAGGTTLVDSNLSIDYDGQAVLITSGSYTGQARDIEGDTSGGIVTPSSDFGGTIVAGTTFLILSGIPAMAEFDDIKGTGWTDENLTTMDSLIDAIKAVTDNLPDSGALSTLTAYVDALETTLGAINTAAATGAVSDAKLAMAYIKQLVTELIVVDGFHDIPGVDAETNAQMRDIIGGKADTASETAANTDSLVSYLKGLLAITGTRAAATGSGAVSGVKVAMTYLKQLVTELIVVDGLIDTLGTLVGTIDTATTDSLHGKLGTDTELADHSLYDLLGGAALKTNALSAMLGAFTAAQNLKAILGDLTTTKNLGGILGAFTAANNLKALLGALTTTDTLKAILGAYTAAAPLKAAIDNVALEATLATVDGIADDIKALVDSAEAAGPYSYTDGGGEQTVKEDTATTRRRIWLDFSNRNMTQTGTFRIYRKVNGANYDIYATQPVTIGAGDDRAFDAVFTVNQAWKLTYEEDVDEGAARDIPFNVITQVIE